MSEKKKKKTFEEAMRELEETVALLESKELPLNEALDAFERGVLLVKQCRKELDSAEHKVSLLLRNEEGDATGETVPFTPSSTEEKNVQ